MDADKITAVEIAGAAGIDPKAFRVALRKIQNYLAPSQ